MEKFVRTNEAKSTICLQKVVTAFAKQQIKIKSLHGSLVMLDEVVDLLSIMLLKTLDSQIRRISNNGVEAAGFHDLGELGVPIEDVDAVAFIFIEEEHFLLLVKIGAD